MQQRAMMSLKLLFRNCDAINRIIGLVPGFVKSLKPSKHYYRICIACCKHVGRGNYCGSCFNKFGEILPPIWMNCGLHFFSDHVRKEYKDIVYKCNELEYQNRKRLQSQYQNPMEESYGYQNSSKQQ